MGLPYKMGHGDLSSKEGRRERECYEHSAVLTPVVTS